MGNYQSIQKANFEDIQYILQKNKGTILLNTLHVNNQSCLIPNTLPLHSEESVINEMLNTNKNGHIVIYGKIDEITC